MLPVINITKMDILRIVLSQLRAEGTGKDLPRKE